MNPLHPLPFPSPLARLWAMTVVPRGPLLPLALLALLPLLLLACAGQKAARPAAPALASPGTKAGAPVLDPGGYFDALAPEAHRLTAMALPREVPVEGAWQVPAGALLSCAGGPAAQGAPPEEALVEAVVLFSGAEEACRALGPGGEPGAEVGRRLAERPYLRVVAAEAPLEATQGPAAGMWVVHGLVVDPAHSWRLARVLGAEARRAQELVVRAPSDAKARTELLVRANLEAWQKARQEALAMDQACEQGQLAPCAEAGRLWSQGWPRGFNPQRAQQLWQRACERASGPPEWESCVAWGRFLLDTGHNPALQKALAQPLERACQGGMPSACTVYGELHASAVLPESSLAQASSYLEQGCLGRDPRGCTRRGQLALFHPELPPELTEGVRWLEEACSLGHVEGCMHAAAITPQDLPRSRERMRRAFGKACEVGQHGACALWAQSLVKSGLVANPAALAPEVRGWLRALFAADCLAGQPPVPQSENPVCGELALVLQSLPRD